MIKLSILTSLFVVLALNAWSEEGEEASASVGPDKGIVELNERLGFKLSQEATKNFSLKSLYLKGDGPWEIPHAAVLTSGEEVNIYRKRSGFIKRIDFQTIRNNSPKNLVIDSDDLREGDEVITEGVAFVRIAELSLAGGLSHSH